MEGPLLPQCLFLEPSHTEDCSPVEFFKTLLAPHTHLELDLNILPTANVIVHIPLTRLSPNINANNDDVLVYGSILREFS